MWRAAQTQHTGAPTRAARCMVPGPKRNRDISWQILWSSELVHCSGKGGSQCESYGGSAAPQTKHLLQQQNKAITIVMWPPPNPLMSLVSTSRLRCSRKCTTTATSTSSSRLKMQGTSSGHLRPKVSLNAPKNSVTGSEVGSLPQNSRKKKRVRNIRWCLLKKSGNTWWWKV